ncbi:MAG TPA: DUF3800 domain-containing protein [Acidimicrobiales bacterium]
MGDARREILRVYVDETGDRGTGPRSSPFFTFAAVAVRERDDHLVRTAAADICTAVGKPGETKLKWTKLQHLSRVRATQMIAELPVTLIYVCFPKCNLRADAALVTDHTAFYNYAARFVLERVSWLAKRNDQQAVVTFEKVRGFDPRQLTDYLDLLRGRSEPSVEWDNLSPNVRVDSPANVSGLVVPDLCAGAFDSATRPDGPTGLYEPVYLQALAPLVWSPTGRTHGYGLKVLGPFDPLASLPWWEAGPFTR